MSTTNWPFVIRGLIASGLTQPKLAELCGCGQSSLSDLLRGKTADPRHSTGDRLLALARERGVAADPEQAPAAEEQGVSHV